MLRILAVRHGQTEWNLAGRNQGHADTDLDEVGRRQSKELAAVLKDEKFDGIYSSPMKRAVQSLQAFQNWTELKVELDERLKERNYGLWEGKTQEEAKQSHPELYVAYHADPTTYAPPDGESGIQVFCRVGYFLCDLLARHESGNVLVMSHGGTLSALLAALLFGTPSTANAFRIRNCSITEIRQMPNGRRRLLRFDDTSHLSRPPIDAYSGYAPARL